MKNKHWNRHRINLQKIQSTTGSGIVIGLIYFGGLIMKKHPQINSVYANQGNVILWLQSNSVNFSQAALASAAESLEPSLSISESISESESESDFSEASADIEDSIDASPGDRIIRWLSNNQNNLYLFIVYMIILFTCVNLGILLILARLSRLKNHQRIAIDLLTLETLTELKNLLVETQNSLFWLQDYLENETNKASQSREFYASGRLTETGWSSFSRSIRDSQVFEPDTSPSLLTQNQTEDSLINSESQSISNSMRAGELLEQANALLVKGLYAQAIAKIEQSITLNPGSGQAWLNRGCALFYLKEYEMAIASYDQALHQGGDCPDAWYNRAGALVQLQQYTEAIASYERATQINPNYLAAWHDRGLILMSLQRYSEALTCFKLEIQLKPNSPEFRVHLGQAFSKLGEYPEAIAAYEQAIHLQPDYTPAWVQFGCVLAAMQRHSEAVAAYDRALKLSPDDAMVWNYLGIALGNLGNYPEALAAYNQALTLKPNWPVVQSIVQNNRAAMLMKLQRYSEAIAACDRAIALEPDQPAIWYNKACCYGIQGDVDRAIENLQQAICRHQATYLDLAKADADFDPIRQDPRFQRIIQHNEQSSFLQ